MAKGGNFEREVFAEMSRWFGGRDDIFYRSNASGARFTSRKKRGKDTAYQSGDMTFTDPVGKTLCDCWSVECKTGYGVKKKDLMKRWDILDFLDSRQEKPVLQKMWEQCVRDADLANKEPILIFRRNNRGKCIMFRTSYLLFLQNYFGDYLLQHIIIRVEMNCVIMPLQVFFEWIPDIRPALTKRKSTIRIRRN
jgi:hypothetical protein